MDTRKGKDNSYLTIGYRSKVTDCFFIGVSSHRAILFCLPLSMLNCMPFVSLLLAWNFCTFVLFSLWDVVQFHLILFSVMSSRYLTHSAKGKVTWVALIQKTVSTSKISLHYCFQFSVFPYYVTNGVQLFSLIYVCHCLKNTSMGI